MPKLTIHPPVGPEQERALTPTRVVTIGRHHTCDISLADELDVALVHCRVIWHQGVYHVAADSRVGQVVVNGRPRSSRRLRHGDEIQVGRYIIRYVEKEDESRPAAAAPAAADQDEAGLLARVLEDLEKEAARAPVLPRPAPPRKRWWPFGRSPAPRGGEPALEPAPGRLLTSPLAIGLGVGLSGVAVLVLVLWSAMARRAAQAQYQAAADAFREQLYRQAARGFEKFLADHPRSELAPQARYELALCQVLQLTDTASPSWPGALKAMRALIDSLGQEAAFQEDIERTGTLLGEIMVGLVEQARRGQDQAALDQALEAKQLLEREVPVSKRPAKLLERFPKALAEAQAAIRKRRFCEASLASLDQALAGSDLATAYRVYERLVSRWPDQAADAKVVERLRRAVEAGRQAVRFRSDGQAARREDREPVQAAITTLVTTDRGSAAWPPAGEVVFLLEGGMCRAFEAAGGRLVWQRPVGYDTTALPVAVPEETPAQVVLVDSRYDELVAVQRDTGRFLWRQPLGGPCTAGPTVVGRTILVAVADHHVVGVDSRTGQRQWTIDLGLPVAGPAAADPSGRYIYVPGRGAWLAVVDLAEARCTDMVHLGHRDGSLGAPLTGMGRYLLVCDNDRLGRCRLRLLLAEGERLRQVQQVEVKGQVHRAPAWQGGYVYVATDQGLLYAFSVGPYERPEPLTLVAQTSLEAGRGGPAPYVWAESETRVWVGHGALSVFRLQAQEGQWRREWNGLPGGWVCQPIQPVEGGLVVGRRLADSPGVRLAAVDRRTFQTRWQSACGQGLWALAEPAPPTGDILAVDARGQQVILTEAQVLRGGPATQPWEPGGERLSPVAADGRWISIGPERVYFPGRGSARLWVRDVRAGAGPSDRRWLELPEAAQCVPLPFQDGLIVAGQSGRLYWIAPPTGRELAEPFEPPVDLKRPVRWTGLAVAGPGRLLAADDRGQLLEIHCRDQPLAHLAAGRRLKLDRPVASPIGVSASTAYFVDAANCLHAVDLATLKPRARQTLPGPLGAGPVVADGAVLLAIGSQTLMCLEPDTSPRWRMGLEGRPLVGDPVLMEDEVWVALADGALRAIGLADGRLRWQATTGVPLRVGPMTIRGRIAVLGANGDFHVLSGARGSGR